MCAVTKPETGAASSLPGEVEVHESLGSIHGAAGDEERQQLIHEEQEQH